MFISVSMPKLKLTGYKVLILQLPTSTVFQPASYPNMSTAGVLIWLLAAPTRLPQITASYVNNAKCEREQKE